VLLASYRGLKRGLIKELVSLISLIAGIYIATNFSIYLEAYLSKYFPEYGNFISITSFIIVFLIVFISLKLAGILISKLAKSLQLGTINKVLGLLFAGSKTLLIISFILFELNHLSNQFGTIIPEDQKSESVLYEKVFKIIPVISPVVKENLDWKNDVKLKINEVKGEIKNRLDTIPVSL
jgi:membrane protein required for colicin V production